MSDPVKFILMMVIFCMPLAGLTMAVDCPVGDLHPDCKIDIQDLSLFAQQWLGPFCSGPTCADFTGSDGVNNADFAILASNWQLQRFPVLINEFMAKNDSFVQDPTGDYDDWIEIHNYSGASVDIAGMYLTDKPLDSLQWWQVPFGYPAETTIPPQGFIVIWADEQLTEGPLHANFKLSASGETIALINPDSATVNSVTFSAAQGDSNESYGRNPDASDTWQIFTPVTTVPSPGLSNGSPTIDIVINEVMYHPSSELDAEEYVELYNNGTGPVNLTAWQFSEGVAFTFPNVTINPSQYLVVAADVSAFAAKYPAVSNVIGGWTGKLSNNSEDIELLNSLGVRIDRIDYADQGDWNVRQLGPLDHGHRGWEWSNEHDGGGKSLELIAPSLENAYGQNWKTSITAQGTPGTANSVATAAIAPVILDVKHAPKIPNSTDAVVVTANVIDELSAINAVTLYYRLDTSVYSTNVYPTYNPASYTILTMYDDGAHGDDLAADGVYGASIPAQADSTIIEFFVKADDTTANSRTWPAPSIIDGTPEQVTNVLYQVDDDFDAAAVWQGGSRSVYRLVMTKAENDRLKDIGDGEGGEQESNAQMNATFISIDGTDIKDRYNVGVRNRGQSSRTGPPNNYRVNFVHDAKWKKLSAMTINYSYPYSQLIGNVIFKMAGLTAPDAQDIRLIVNGEDISTLDNNMFGSYVQIETFGGDFVDHHFPADSDGNLYKAQIWCQSCTPTQWIAGLYYEGPNPSDYTSAGYYKNTNEEYNDWSDLINLTNVLDNASNETYTDQVRTVVDVDQWVRWFAVNNLIGNNETSLGNGRGDDYRLYMGVNDPRAKLVVHDMDTVLGLGDEPNDAQDSIFRAADPVHLPIIERFLKHSDFAPMYYAQLMELCETVFSPEQFDPVIDRVLGDRLPQSTIDALKQFAVDRVASVLTQIPLDLTATSSLSVSDSLFRTTSNSGLLSGYANAIDTRAVTINALPATWNAADAPWTVGSC